MDELSKLSTKQLKSLQTVLEKSLNVDMKSEERQDISAIIGKIKLLKKKRNPRKLYRLIKDFFTKESHGLHNWKGCVGTIRKNRVDSSHEFEFKPKAAHSSILLYVNWVDLEQIK